MRKFLSRVHSAYDAPSPADARETRSIFKPRMRRPNFLASVVVNTIRALALIVLILMLAGAGAVVGIARAYVDTAPSLDLTLIDDQAQTSFIYDAQGNLITDYKGTEDRVMVSISQMPMRLRNAFVAVEDARFYTHNGIDVKRIIGAFVKNFVSGSQQGGSTITQQLIKNTILSSEQSYKRKIQEAYLAMQLETQYSKEQILESYLNTIYLGENYYGVYTAARGYFGKELYQLSLRECAMLAGLCTNPYYYNPRRNYYTRTSETTDYAAITNTRTDYALRMMYENQFITYEEYVAALEPSTATVLRQSPDAGSTYNYIYYVEYAVNDVVQTLLKLNNLENTSYNRNLMENELRTGGYHVYLCLDTEIQKTVEDTLYSYQSYPSLRDPADKIYRARNADGTYAGMASDSLCIAITDLCKMSNSRIDRLLNSLVSELPAFLNKNADFNNGLMMIQYASAGLQGELRILAHPAVVDNLTTCANQEDYVNMGCNAAKKAYDSMHLAKYILAAELICDGQALDCYDDKRCAKGTQAIYDLLRSKVPEMDNDMPLTPYLEAVAQQIIDRAYIRTVEASVGALKF